MKIPRILGHMTVLAVGTVIVGAIIAGGSWLMVALYDSTTPGYIAGGKDAAALVAALALFGGLVVFAGNALGLFWELWRDDLRRLVLATWRQVFGPGYVVELAVQFGDHHPPRRRRT